MVPWSPWSPGTQAAYLSFQRSKWAVEKIQEKKPSVPTKFYFLVNFIRHTGPMVTTGCSNVQTLISGVHTLMSNVLILISNVQNLYSNAQWEFARPVLKNLKLKLEVRWVLQNWGKTEAFRCFLRKWKSVKNWLRYKQFSDFPNSKIFAGMLKKTGRATFPLCNALYT